MMAGMVDAEQGQEKHDVGVADMITQTFSKIGSNDLASLKEYLESGQSGIEEYTSAVEYSYSVTPQIYLWKDGSYRKVNPDESFAPLGLARQYIQQHDGFHGEHQCVLPDAGRQQPV